LNYYSNNNAFDEPYENALKYSFFILFFIVDYVRLYDNIIDYFSKFINFIQNESLYNIITSSYFITIYSCIITAITMYIEPLICYEEYSMKKMISRIGFSIYFLGLNIFFELEEFSYITLYILGYMLCSCLSQIYCYISKENDLEEKELKENDLEEKELKENDLEEKEFKENDLEENEFKENDLEEKELKENDLEEKELKEKEFKENDLEKK
jgi:hypothetical protein